MNEPLKTGAGLEMVDGLRPFYADRSRGGTVTEARKLYIAIRVLLKYRALFFYQENHQYGDNDGS